MLDAREGEFVDGLSLVCEGWELRVTTRCLTEDLEAVDAADLNDVAGHPIVKALVRERRDKVRGTRKVSPLSHPVDVWVLAHQHRHRGGTWFDAEYQVVWLLAYGRHESGSDEDFFPRCKALDEEDRLLPTADDYEKLFRARDRRVVARIMIEAPLAVKEARMTGNEVSARLGGQFGVAVALEVADDLEEITVAAKLQVPADFEYLKVALTAIKPGDVWEMTDSMPSRSLEPGEFAYFYLTQRDS